MSYCNECPNHDECATGCREGEALRRANPPEGGVITIPADLFHKILGQHRLAATALIDGHGDIHRAIVREMESFEPQSGSK